MQPFGCRMYLRLPALLPACTLFAMSAVAPVHAYCSGNQATTTITLPTTVAVPRNGTAGGVLWSSGWVGTEISRVTGCRDSVENREWGYLAASRQTAQSGVYATNVAGVGMQLYWLNTNTHSPLPGQGRSHLVTWPASTGELDQAQRFNLPARFYLRLIRTGAIGAGKLALSTPLAYVKYGSVRVARLDISGTTAFNAASCATPDVTVNLGTHAAAKLDRVGSRTNAVAFELKINQCPTGLTAVRYGFNSPTTDYVPRQGLVGLTRASTARGIKVKLLNADATGTVELDKWYTLTAYNAGRGGNYSVRMSAAYERTSSAAVTSGTANAEVSIAMSYE